MSNASLVEEAKWPIEPLEEHTTLEGVNNIV